MGAWRSTSYRHHRSRGGVGRGGRGEMQRRNPSGKPPPSGGWQAGIPSWERDFCLHVGQISWVEFVKAKEVMPIYKNIMQWDDSAGEEAFCNAKARYWASINDLPCNCPLPDPDMYIDKVDWNCEIDPQLEADLDTPSTRTTNDKLETNSWELPVVPTGWDVEVDVEPRAPPGWKNWGVRTDDAKNTDGEDRSKDIKNASSEAGMDDSRNTTGWEKSEDEINNIKNSSWEDRVNDSRNATGWDPGTGWDDSGVWKRNTQWENKNGSSQVHYWNSDQRFTKWKNETDRYQLGSRKNARKGGRGGGWHGSRNQNSGYKGMDCYQTTNDNWRNSVTDDSWRNCRRMKSSHDKEWTSGNKEHDSTWQVNSLHGCGRVRKEAHHEVHDAWSPVT